MHVQADAFDLSGCRQIYAIRSCDNLGQIGQMSGIHYTMGDRGSAAQEIKIPGRTTKL